MVCKICGKKVPSPEKYMRPESETTICSDHVEYCHKKCGIASSVKGWHYEPCISCEHNPYNNKNV